MRKVIMLAAGAILVLASCNKEEIEYEPEVALEDYERFLEGVWDSGGSEEYEYHRTGSFGKDALAQGTWSLNGNTLALTYRNCVTYGSSECSLTSTYLFLDKMTPTTVEYHFNSGNTVHNRVWTRKEKELQPFVGCIDSLSTAFDYGAEEDDGSCLYTTNVFFWCETDVRQSLLFDNVSSLTLELGSNQATNVSVVNLPTIEPDCGSWLSQAQVNLPDNNAVIVKDYKLTDQFGVIRFEGMVICMASTCSIIELIL